MVLSLWQWFKSLFYKRIPLPESHPVNGPEVAIIVRRGEAPFTRPSGMVQMHPQENPVDFINWLNEEAVKKQDGQPYDADYDSAVRAL